MDVAEPRPAFAGGALAAGERWELYKLFGEPVRLRIMALLAEEELTVGELAELLGESQSTISRQIKMLRQRSLVQVRKQGVRVFARFAQEMERDPVVADALTAGTHLCRQERVFARAAEVVRRRDAAARAFFSHEPQAAVEAFSVPDEFAVYLTALSALLPRRALAVDIGTGAGPLLELLSPVYLRVLAVDRSEA
ncbi:MAG: metalloregulator ArsR/SmtB family transcription factor, partial [Myxococcota bacterium]